MQTGRYAAQSLLHPELAAVVWLDGTSQGRVIRERIVSFIRSYWWRYGRAPFLSEVCTAAGLRSRSSAHHQLWLLRRAGRVEFTPRTHGSIRLVEQ